MLFWEEAAVTLQVNGIAGPLCTIEATTSWDLARLRREIACRTGIPLGEQSLVSLDLLRSPKDQAQRFHQVRHNFHLDKWETAFMLQVNGLAGPLCTIGVRTSWTLKGIQHEIARITGIPEGEQSFVSLDLRNHTKAQAQWLSKIQHNPDELATAPTVIRENREIVFNAVCHRPQAFVHAAMALREDRALARVAVRCGEQVLPYLAQDLWSDRVFVADVLSDVVIVSDVVMCPKLLDKVLGYVAQDLWSDRVFVAGIVSDAVTVSDVDMCPKLFDKVLGYVAQDLWADRDFVLDLVRRDARVYRYASPVLKDDRAFVVQAIQCNLSVFTKSYLPDRFENDRGIVIAAVRANWHAFRFTKLCFREEREIVLAAVKQSARALEYGGSTLRDDPEIRMALEAHSGLKVKRRRLA